MASQNDSDIFSVRIVSLDYYMCPPIPDLDYCYSSFQGNKVEEVPVIRIFGSTPANQKTCLHVHRALPYFYIPFPDDLVKSPEEGDAFIHTLFNAIEKTLRHKPTSKRQHVHACTLVRAKKLYGYHSSEEVFVKIILYYPHDVPRAASFLLDGSILGKSFQPFESHIPYLLHFLVDYNLYGMSHFHTSKVKFRSPLTFYNARALRQKNYDAPTTPSSSSCEKLKLRGSTAPSALWPDPIPSLGSTEDKCIHLARRQSICQLEADASVEDIINAKFKIYTSLSQTRSDVRMVQSLVPIWEEEYERSGVHEEIKQDNPTRPHPDTVLRSFMHGLDYIKSLSDFCIETCNSFPTWIREMDGNDKLAKYISSFSNISRKIELVGHEQCSSSCDVHLLGKKEDNINKETSSQRLNGCEGNEHGIENIMPFFPRVTEDVDLHDESVVSSQVLALGIPSHFQNDGSVLYLLTHALTPPTSNAVYDWLSVGKQNFMIDTGGTSKESFNSYNNGVFHEGASSQLNEENWGRESEHFQINISCVSRELKLDSTPAEENIVSDDLQDLSQISCPEKYENLNPTPLSQIGFVDPACLGCGQQLTLMSMELQAEARGDLRPDPKFDAINILSLVVQEDASNACQIYILLRVDDEEMDEKNGNGVFDCKMFFFTEERLLLEHFVEIISYLDPDILMGWEIQHSSLGYLIERASYLGMNLLKKISRTPFHEKIENSKDSGCPESSDVLPEVNVAGTILKGSIIEDDWGRTHASGLHVDGRIVLNIWRLMRAELKLNTYTADVVAEEVLRKKLPLFSDRVLNQWYSSGVGRARHKCIEYCIARSMLTIQLMGQLDMINRTSELSRIFGIDFFSVISRGSQYRVESMLLRLAHTQNYLAISPGYQQVASQPAMECLPLVMEPESGFYADPVVVLDFQSLYPSMIIAYNLCFCTCLGKLIPSKENVLGVSSYSPDVQSLKALGENLLLTPNGVMYVPTEVQKGVLPRLLEEILSTRIMVKQAMKKLKSSQLVLHRILNARQLALKLIANVTYGYTAAGFSGRMPCAEIADSIVQCGRITLEAAISFVNQHEKWKAKVIYGDTDSMFVLLKGRSKEDAFVIGNEIASTITAMNPEPVTLKMEKVYQPCFLLTKKRYVGYSYESPRKKKPVFDAKGIETVRRDTCPAVAKTLERSIRLFFENKDLSKVESYLKRQWTRILSGKTSLKDFVFAKEVRLGSYRTSSLPPAAIVAMKAMEVDPRAEPHYGERVPYIVVHGEPGSRLMDMVVNPLEVLDLNSPYRPNDLYYIKKQMIPALQRVFGLLGANVNKWFSAIPRPIRPSLAKRSARISHSRSSLEGYNDNSMVSKKEQAKSRIDAYYSSKHCPLCGDLIQSSDYFCAKCSKKESLLAAAMVGKTSKREREMQHLAEICRHCGGSDWVVECGVKCTSLACSVFYERRKVQKELKALSSFATEAGFYPPCNAELF